MPMLSQIQTTDYAGIRPVFGKLTVETGVRLFQLPGKPDRYLLSGILHCSELRPDLQAHSRLQCVLRARLQPHRRLGKLQLGRQTMPPEEYEAKRRFFAANSIGGYPFVGTPDHIAEELAIISQAGVRGIGLSFVNYLDEVPYFCDEVLPRLVRQGIRVKAGA
jgi:alkanesulfonate monooxygenase SsuD/methylene tetrahydromethanopterin reductase-like flavin-dependent oxidoreductase (luciferase family)